MKKILRYSTLVLLLCALTSCSGFLNEKLATSYSGKVMVSSKDALEANVLGIHKQLAGSGFKTGAFCEWLAPASGLLHWGNTTGTLTNPLERWTCCLKFTRFSHHPEAYESFSSFYRTIYLCNSLLDAMESSPVQESYKSEIAGEVYFLRAMSYFYLVRLYGDVTLKTEVPASTDDVYGTRENFWVVYCQIVQDLSRAAQQMRSFDRCVQIAGGNSSGRVCNYAAIACRSLVYLTIGTLLAHPDDNFWVDRTPDFSEIGINTAEDAFKLALNDAEDVIDNGPFELCKDYRQLFRWTEPADWQLKERIWAMPRSPETNDSGSALTMWALPRYYMNSAGAEHFGRCRPDRWLFQKWCETYGGVKGTDAENAGIYVDCPDPRMKTNLIYTSYMAKDNAVMNCYPQKSRIHPGNGTMMKYYGLPYFKKYYDPTFNNSVGNSDLYVMRLAEVYLIAAEAAVNLSASPSDQNAAKAVGYVNVLLERARKSTPNGVEAAEPHAWAQSDFATKEALLDGIFWERCFEMPFEHHEYFDTHRMGAKWLAEHIAKPKNEFLYLPEQDDYELGGQEYEGYRSIYYGQGFRYDEDWTLVRKGLICAYPYDELIYNKSLDVDKRDPNLGQNPEAVCWR